MFNRDHLNRIPSILHLPSIYIETPLKIGEICILDEALYDVIKMLFKWFLFLSLHLNDII